MAIDWSQFEPVSPAKPQGSGSVDWSFFEPAPKNESDFGRGVKESFQQLPQLGYGVVAGAGAAGESMFGSGGFWSGVKKAGVQGYQEWGDKIASKAKESDSWNYSWEAAKQGDFGALVDWLQHGLGYVGGQAIQMLATAGIGAVGGKFVAGTAAKQIAEGMVAKEAAKLTGETAGKMAAEDIARQATANVAAKFASAGSSAAMGATAVGMEGGEIFGDLAKRSVEDGRVLTGEELGKAFGATLAAGGLEFVGDKLGLDIVLGKSPFLKPAAGMGGLGGRLARGATAAAAQTPVEAATEYAQTVLEEFGKGGDPFSSETMKQASDAAALGALGGAAIGGIGGAARGPVARPAPEAEPDPIQAIGDAKTIDEAIAATQQAIDLPDSKRTPEQAIQSIEAAGQGADRLGVRDWSWLPESSMVEADWLKEARRIAAGDQAEIAAEQRRAEIEAQPVDRAPRQRTDALEMQPVDRVTAFVDDLRQTNTPAARAFVQEFDAGRITRAEVEQRMAREAPRTDAQIADERLAAAAAQAPKAPDGLLLTADGFPYGTRSGAVVRARREGLTTDSVIEVAGGYAVRKETPDAQPDVAVPAAADAGARPAGPGDALGGDGTVRPVADDAIGPAGADTAPAGEGGEPGVQPGHGGGPADSLTTLKAQWTDAVRRGDTQAAAEINQRIVEAKNAPRESRGPAASRQWVDEGKTPDQLLQDKIDGPAQELAFQIAEEARSQDFAPNEVPKAIEAWAKEASVPADQFRQTVLKSLDKTDISDAQKARVRKALSPLRERAKALKPKPAEPSPPVEATGEPRGQEAQEEPQEVLSAPPAQTPAAPAPTVMGLTEDQRRASIDSEAMEDRPDAPEVAQPIATKAVKVFARTMDGIKTVRAKLYELPGYKGPQLAVAEYKTSRGQGYRVYLPKSGAFIADSNGVASLEDTLKLAVLRVQHARDTVKARSQVSQPAQAQEQPATATHADPGQRPETATTSAVKATAQNAIDAFNADDDKKAMALVQRIRAKDELRAVGDGIGFSMHFGEGAEAYRKRLSEVAPRLTKTAREKASRQKGLYDKLIGRAMDYDRAASHMENSLRLGNAVDSEANTTSYRPMDGGDPKWLPIPQALDLLAADVASLRNDPDYAEVAPMVSSKRPRVFEHKPAATTSSPVNATAPTKPQPAPDGETAAAQEAVAPSLKARVEAMKPSREVIEFRKRLAVLNKLKECLQ